MATAVTSDRSDIFRHGIDYMDPVAERKGLGSVGRVPLIARDPKPSPPSQGVSFFATTTMFPLFRRHLCRTGSGAMRGIFQVFRSSRRLSRMRCGRLHIRDPTTRSREWQSFCGNSAGKARWSLRGALRE